MPSDDETENRNEVAEANTSHLTVIDEVKEEDELEEVAKEEKKVQNCSCVIHHQPLILTQEF